MIGFGIASFLSDAGHEAATAALPAFLITLGAAPAALGVIEGIADGASSFAKLIGGWIADKPQRRKPIAVAGYLTTGLATGAFGLATSWLHILAARSFGWLARGVRGPARDAMLADAVPPQARGRAFGFHRALDTAGAVAGPALALILGTFLPLRAIFVWALVPGVLAAVAFALLVRREDGTRIEPQPFLHSLGALPRPFVRLLAAVFLFGIGDFARTLLILRATELLIPTMGAAAAGATAMALYIGHNIIYAAASYPVGWAADRISPRKLLAVGYLLGTVTAAIAAVATPSLAVLAVLFAVAGLTLAFEDTLEKTMTAHAVPKELRGTGYGALAATNGVGDLVSSSLVGVLWSVAGAGVAFATAAALCLAGTLVLAAGWKEASSELR
ncbi:MAG TPA: MFS transporter [Kofleriaceae bacterium]|nr:MFS transporter [Kofleriaceae bacterium]